MAPGELEQLDPCHVVGNQAAQFVRTETALMLARGPCFRHFVTSHRGGWEELPQVSGPPRGVGVTSYYLR